MNKFRMTLLALGFSLAALASDVPGISVHYVATGSLAYVQAISAIGRIEFKDAHASLVFKDAAAGQQDLGATSSIQRIVFGAVSESSVLQADPTAAPEVESNVAVSAYPNPVADHLHVSGIASGMLLRLFAADGKLVFSGTQADIDMSAMPSGVYFLQAGQEFAKVIKK